MAHPVRPLAMAMSDRTEPPFTIVTSALTKHYGNVVALADVSLSVPNRSIYGFLGPNGAGKTTVIRLLLGFIRPTSGHAQMFGFETWNEGVAARERVGYLVSSSSLYPDMSGADQLDFAVRLSQKEPVLRKHLLDLLELSSSDLNRRFSQYSKGMKQKLALVCAAQHDPELLILDEPTDGLDPLIRRRFETFLQDFNARERTIFMSSHDLAEVDRVCHLVAIVKEGRLILQQSVEAFRENHARQAEIIFANGIPDSNSMPGRLVRVDTNASRVVLQVDRNANELVDFLSKHDIVDVTIAAPRLDDVFMNFYSQNDKPIADLLDDQSPESGDGRLT